MLSTYTSYQLIAKDLSLALKRKGAETTVARETAYYQANIEKVKTIDDLLADKRLYAYAMKAHGLEDMTYAKAFMRKVLNEGVDAKTAFANRLTDERYKAFAKVFDFKTYGTDTTLRTATNDKTVAAYKRQQLENDAGADDTGVRLALYFARKAPEITTGYGVLGDTALSQVVKTVLGLPDAGASETALARQADLIERKVDLASFKDPVKLEKFLKRFTAIWDAQNNTASAPVLSLFSDSASAGLDASLLLSLQRIRSGELNAMQNGLYVALSAQVAMEKRLNAVAQNVANLSTSGYRAEDTKFSALLAQASKGPVAFASSGDTYISQRSGPVTKTDSALDVAVQGEAWLAVRGASGPVYTRDGRMTMDSMGQLRNLTGQAMLDPGGSPILLDPQAGPPTIGRDGSVSQGVNQVGALGLFTLDPKGTLRRAEPNGVTSSQPAQAVQDFTRIGVIQGHIEGANVNPVLEMTKLITIQRAFESAATLTAETESSFQGAIRSLSPQGS